MNNEKFTPGPWEVNSVGWGYRIEPDIAWLGDKSNVHDEVNRANAALIAAAPEMYETLNDICNDCEKLANWEDLFNVGVEGISVQYPKCPCEDCNIAKVLREARGEE